MNISYMAMPGVNAPTIKNYEIDRIFILIEKALGVNRSKIMSRARDTETCIARHMFSYLANKTTRNSLEKIGEYTCRTHWNVRDSIKTVNGYLRYDEWWQCIIELMLNELKWK